MNLVTFSYIYLETIWCGRLVVSELDNTFVKGIFLKEYSSIGFDYISFNFSGL